MAGKLDGGVWRGSNVEFDGGVREEEEEFRFSMARKQQTAAPGYKCNQTYTVINYKGRDPIRQLRQVAPKFKRDRFGPIH